MSPDERASLLCMSIVIGIVIAILVLCPPAPPPAPVFPDYPYPAADSTPYSRGTR